MQEHALSSLIQSFSLTTAHAKKLHSLLVDKILPLPKKIGIESPYQIQEPALAKRPLGVYPYPQRGVLLLQERMKPLEVPRPKPEFRLAS